MTRPPDWNLHAILSSTIEAKNDDRGKVGVAWNNEDGSISIVLNLAVVLDERATRRREQELAPRFNDIELLKIQLERAKIDLPELQAATTAEVALAKARSAFEELKRPLIIEDAGVELHALGSFPGPFIKFWEKLGGLASICRAADVATMVNNSSSAVSAAVSSKRRKVSPLTVAKLWSSFSAVTQARAAQIAN